MDSFEEWARSSTTECAGAVQTYADRLMELGATWDSFRSREPAAIVEDLVQGGGIPLLAARDITDAATKFVRQCQAPLAIFWDTENMPIPAETSNGRHVSLRLKSIVKPYGELVDFRAYASSACLNPIPEQDRLDLQLAGCLLVDCPPSGPKEVVDKMIIVDAMNFAMLNPDGATLCFVTGDVDYAYMLAILQRHKQYRIIVISKRTFHSMLDANCDLKMHWESSILQLRSSPLSKNTLQDPKLSWNGTDLTDASSGTSSVHEVAQETTFEPLTDDAEWIIDAEMLRNLIRRETASSGSALQSQVRKLLRHTFPERFPDRKSVKKFFTEAVKKRVVLPTGKGSSKAFVLPTHDTTEILPAMPLSDRVPLLMEEIPERVLRFARKLPYIVFVEWHYCPSGTDLSNIFVQQKRPWGFLMFSNLGSVRRAELEYPWLRNGILVDWRKANTILLNSNGQPSAEGIVEAKCCAPLETMESGGCACAECLGRESMPEQENNDAAAKVVNLLEFMAENDDLRVPENILRKRILLNSDLKDSVRNHLCISKCHNDPTVALTAEEAKLGPASLHQNESIANERVRPTEGSTSPFTDLDAWLRKVAPTRRVKFTIQDQKL